MKGGGEKKKTRFNTGRLTRTLLRKTAMTQSRTCCQKQKRNSSPAGTLPELPQRPHKPTHSPQGGRRLALVD